MNLKKKCVNDYDKILKGTPFSDTPKLTTEMRDLIINIQEVMNNREIGKTVLDKNSGFHVKEDAGALDNAINEMKKELNKNRVFISVSSKSVDRVKPLKEYLEGEDIDTFLYEGDILSGEDFNDIILSAINNAELVICFIDDNYLCREFAITECIYSFASKDTNLCLWIDSSVDVDLADNKKLRYFKLLKFIIEKIQKTDSDKKEAIARDLTKLKELSFKKVIDSKSFCDAYESMSNQKSKD